MESLQEQFDNHSSFCIENKESELSKSYVENIIGERDSLGRLHGDVEIFYENGDYVWADFVHGIKEGSASIVFQNGDHYSGHFHHDQLNGLVIETIDFCDFHNIRREVFYKVNSKLFVLYSIYCDVKYILRKGLDMDFFVNFYQMASSGLSENMSMEQD